jgi:predicted permease
MSLRSRMSTWWRAVRREEDVHAQIDEELQFHVESYAADLMRDGTTRAEAMRRARAELGSLTANRENCRAASGTRWFDELSGDLRYAVRMLRKSPGFAAIAVGSLALGIGANTAIFSIAKPVLLNRLHVPHPEQLRLLQWTTKSHDSVVHSTWGEENRGLDGTYSTSFPYPVYQALTKQNHGLAELFAFKGSGRMDVTVDGEAEVVQTELVSGNYYQQMGVQPQLGRAIESRDDENPGASPVVTISDGYWTRRFNRSPGVIGQRILLNLTPMTIVGVNPQGFTGAKTVQASPEVFAPMTMAPLLVTRPWPGSLLTNPQKWWMQMMARTRPGASEAAAQAELDAALRAVVLATMRPKAGEEIPRLVLGDGSRGLNGMGRALARPLYVLLGLVGLVLLLACANMANLLLARSSARQREMSVRLALGAARGRIVRQLLTESLLLAAMGGMAGLLLGYAGKIMLLRITASPESVSWPNEWSWGVFAFNAGLSIATGLLFGIVPAWGATRTQVSSGLKDSTHTATRRRRGYGGKAIVGFQIAVSLLLVAGAGVFLRTLINLNRIDPGFDAKNLVLFQINPPGSRYPREKQPGLYQRIEEQLAALPGVEAATASSITLLANDRSMDDFVPEGGKAGAKDQGALDNYVGDGYFVAMRIPIIAGRGFTARDTSTSMRVGVVNQSLAKQDFPGQNPIGKTFTTTDMENRKLIYTVVGVCADTRYANLRDDPPPTFFLSYKQAPDVSWGMTFAVRTRLSRAAITPGLRRAVQLVDPDLPLMDVRSQREQVDEITKSERIFADLTGGFGVLALALACIGIYGIMAFAVSQRTNEIGIRMALGARPEQVLRMVLAEASWMALLGLLAGVGAALALGRLIASMLYGLEAWDPATFAGSTMLLLVVALAASWVPARRAAGVDPMRALRHE